MQINIDELSLKELRSLESKVAKAIETYEQRMKKQALLELVDHAKAMGFTLSELLAAQAGTKSKARSEPAAKYGNPADHNQTWSGRGRRPGWFIQALEDGKSPEDMLI